MARNKHGYSSDVCLNCGRPSDGRTRCKACMAMTTRANKARRDRYRAEGRCTICGALSTSGYCDPCRARERVSQQVLRLECIVAYGGKCVCCGDDHPEFLQLDHVEGNGAAERQTAAARGLPQNLYSRLKKQGYPSGYQVLCANCNLALGFYGRCPHRPEIVRKVRGRDGAWIIWGEALSSDCTDP